MPSGTRCWSRPYNDLDAVTAIVEEHHDSLAGVIVEAFQRVIQPRPGFLQGLRALTERHGLPLAFDEVVTSFRFAYGGAQEFYGVTPDLCTVGKVVGGGFPSRVWRAGRRSWRSSIANRRAMRASCRR